MWFDGVRQPDTLYVASVSRGKDSTAMLRAIQLMGWPLDMIAAVDIWATDDIPAELPPMVAFKDEWDEKCLERFGLPVTRLCARRKVDERERERETFERRFYSAHVYGNTRVAHPERDGIYGFPIRAGAWCNSKLKVAALRENDIRERFLSRPEAQTEASQREREREREGKPTGFAQIKGNWCCALKTRNLGRIYQGFPQHIPMQVVSQPQEMHGQTDTRTGRDGQRGTASGATQGSKAEFSIDLF